MQYSFVAHATQTAVPMNDFNLLSKDNVAEDWKEREDGWKSCRTVNDEKRNMIDFQTIREISYAGASFVCVSNYHHFMSTINEFRGKLVDVTFDTAGLWKEEVADHCNIVRHFEGRVVLRADAQAAHIQRFLLIVVQALEVDAALLC
jgi:hypothetical protein